MGPHFSQVINSSFSRVLEKMQKNVFLRHCNDNAYTGRRSSLALGTWNAINSEYSLL